MKNVKLNVTGMHCHSCEMLIEESIINMRGVTKVNASHQNSTVAVRFDETLTSIDEVRKTICKEGFSVK